MNQHHSGIARTLGWLLLGGIAAGCSSVSPPVPVAADERVPHVMVEQDEAGHRYTNAVPERVMPVDAHSTLLVVFPKAPPPRTRSLPPEWQRLESTLAYLNERAAEWSEINARNVDLTD